MSERLSPVDPPTPDWNNALSLPAVTWMEPPDDCIAKCANGDFEIHIRYGRINEGPGEGVQVVEIDNGPMQVTLLPTRGMSIWQIVCDGVPFKWNSPISGPIHPSLVPVFDPGGLGWLEGFDEMFVRCGLVSNGAPDFDESTGWRYPLHGRIANLPAKKIWCEASADGVIVSGRVFEQRLFFNNIELLARYEIRFNERSIRIVDTVTNRSTKPIETQMLYHINVGRPVLDEGARLLAPVRELAPRDARAAKEIESWNYYGDAITGFEEVVNFFELNSDDAGQTSVMLSSGQKQNGLGVSWDTATLPYFVQWKNTAADVDGYVTGLEPSTNFPNAKSFESQQERVVTLNANESVSYRLELSPLTCEDRIAEYRKRIQSIELTAEPAQPTLHKVPRLGWSP